ncbi:MAG: hypothetical protein AAB434_05655 [Planctomycetota bacterium]
MRQMGRRIALLLLTTVALLSADDPAAPFKGVVVLKDGRHIEGKITVRADSSVDVELKFGSAHFKAEEIETIQKGEAKPAANKVLAPVEEIDPVYGDLFLKDGRHFAGDLVLRKNTVELFMKIGMVKFGREEMDRIEEKERPVARKPTPPGQDPAPPQPGPPTPAPPEQPDTPEEPTGSAAPEEEAPPLTGDWEVTKEGPQPDYADPAIKARIEEANQAFDASLVHHEAFRASRNDDVRGKEITTCLAEIRKAAGGYASVFDILPNDRWLEDRYRRAIEVLKVVRMQAAQYR